MANIQLTDLAGNIAGFDLFNDSDSFMQDLSEDELDLQGGKAPVPTARLSIFCRPRPIPTPPIVKIE
ncbi:hypothetical protein [Chamaesiphon polymorphus]|uniref:Uncharacterized protein n=1 Tax=Chamaesiphon polymorphus CCALA 037 TaxID=2107692 RepID=A0A2T1FIE0_9CYAN|nr:hypothetical protein [Chamaesiphon polymorphus]PSB44756.1 hypothetical protein C7B77_25525 [Chamaesiphon polymorphus CCALA 037]